MAGTGQHGGAVGAAPSASGGRRGALWRRLRSLRVQILLWTILPIAIFLLGLSFTDVYGHQRAMRTLVEERDSALLRLAIARISEGLAHQASLLQRVAADGAFLAADAAGQGRELARLDDAFPDGVVLVDTEGHRLAASSASIAWAQARFVPHLARAAAAGGQPAFQAGAQEGMPPARLAVAVALPRRDAVLVGTLPLSRSAVLGAVDGLQVAPEATAVLLDGRGLPIYQAAQPGAPAAAHLHGGEDVVTTLAPVPGTDWQLELSEPWHHLVPLVLRYAQATILVAIAAVLISLLAVYLGVRYVTGPLQELGQQARRMAWGDFEAVHDPVGGVEEIADLQRTLKQMAARVRGYQATMRNYVAAVTKAQEEERLRLARELHDETVQSLIALGQQLERLQKAAPVGSGDCHALAEALRQGTRDLVQDVRRLIGDLRPPYLEDLGLVPALEMLAKAQPLPQPPELVVSGRARRLPPDIELTIYRIVQEALKNVEQHARATRVRLQLGFEDDAVRVTVEDDGAGFVPPDSPDELARQGHFGLLGMRERAMLFGGWLAVASQPGRGTRVEAFLPAPLEQ